MTLLCLSDIHGEAAGLKDLLPLAAESDAIVISGDVTHLGGRAEAEAVLEPLLASGLRIIAVAGNMDREGARDLLTQKGIDIHARGIMIDGVGFMGLGGGTPSPFHSPWELEPAEAERCLSAGLSMIADAPYKVLVSHSPPHSTALDRTFMRTHAGSEPVRRFLLSDAVDLCICGHIHEARGEDRLGEAACVNVGPFKNGHYAVITIDDSKTTVSWRMR